MSFSHPNIDKFHERHITAGEVATDGRVIRYADGALLERASGGELVLEPPSDERDLDKRMYEYWALLYQQAKGKFDELYTQLQEHTRAAVNNPGLAPPEPERIKRLQALRAVVEQRQAEMEKYAYVARSAQPVTAAPSSHQMEMVRANEEVAQLLKSMRM